MPYELDPLEVKDTLPLGEEEEEVGLDEELDEPKAQRVSRPGHINFLDETLEHMRRAGVTSDDIKVIGSTVSGMTCTWVEFLVMANFEYQPGRGGRMKIPADLMLEFNDGQRLVRIFDAYKEQWFRIRTIPIVEDAKPIKGLVDHDATDVTFLHKIKANQTRYI